MLPTNARVLKLDYHVQKHVETASTQIATTRTGVNEDNDTDEEGLC